MQSVTTVDSTPTSALPDTTTASILPSRSSSTCSAVVGLGDPERFADGAASGRPLRFIISCATLFDGILTATVSSPALTAAGMRSPLGRTIVNGPGQNASAHSSALAGTFPVTSDSIFISDT